MRTPALALARLALALVLSMLAGVALAGLALPLFGGVGLVAQAGAQTFLDLPSALTLTTLPKATRILAKDGSQIATLFLENRVPVKLASIPLSAQVALVAIEDSRFYEHNGIDVKGTARALARNSSSGSVQQGGSTLTQQYVKNMLLEAARGREAAQDAARERSIKRKLQEARYALALEKTHSKAQILEGYLNIAYYGNGVYGIGTAAQHYFSEPVQRLTVEQGALLAGMVQNPSKFDPQRHPAQAKVRRDVVLARMHELGKLTDAAYNRAVHLPLRLKVTSVSSGCEAPGIKAPFFCDYVRRYLEEGPGGAVLGDTPAKRQETLLAGGLTIRTTLDPRVQGGAQAAVDQQAPAADPSGIAAVADTVEPGTGAVSAMAVDRRFGEKKGETKVNYALGGSLGFQAGSTFKAFVLARALQLGISTGLTLFSPQKYCPKAFPYQLPDHTCGPSNAGDSEVGTYDMVQATWRSVNTYYIQLEERTGLITPPGLAEALGVRSVDKTFGGRPLPREQGSFVLGTDGVSPLAMASAYATFAAHGLYCPPVPVVSITDSNGKALPLASPPCTQALETGVADTVTSILRGVVDGPDPLRTGLGASIGRPAAGKTGTTTGSTAAWFVGYTPQLATAVWVGTPIPSRLVNVRINGQYYRQLYGGSLPASIWHQVMSTALEGVAPVDFEGASLRVSKGDVVRLPDVRGQPVDAAAQQLRDAGFGVDIGRAVAAAPVPAGAVAFTVPGSGGLVPAGSTVTIVPSNGQPPPRPAPVPLGTGTPFFPPLVPTPSPPVAPPAPAPPPTPKVSKKPHP